MYNSQRVGTQNGRVPQRAAIHESRNLKQARPDGQYVDLLHTECACYSLMEMHFKQYSRRNIKCQRKTGVKIEEEKRDSCTNPKKGL